DTILPPSPPAMGAVRVTGTGRGLRLRDVMKTVWLSHAAVFAAILVLAPEGKGQDKTKYPSMGTIERQDPRFDKLVPKDAVIEKLADGFKWSEGPVWVKDGGYLLFSDIPNNRVCKWHDGKVTDYLKPSGYLGKRTDLQEPGSNGLLIDSKGRLI